MAQILNTPTATQMSAQRFTDPIMQSLQNLTNMQLNSINQQKKRANTMAGLSALMTPEQAKMFSYLPEYLQFSLLSKRGGTNPVSRKLTSEMAMQILNKSGGDKNMARKMAKQMGFTF